MTVYRLPNKSFQEMLQTTGNTQYLSSRQKNKIFIELQNLLNEQAKIAYNAYERKTRKNQPLTFGTETLIDNNNPHNTITQYSTLITGVKQTPHHYLLETETGDQIILNVTLSLP